MAATPQSHHRRPSRRGVLFVFHRAYPWTVGGIERFYWALGRELSRSVSVTCVTHRYWGMERERWGDGIRHIGVGPPNMTLERAVSERGKLAFALRVMLHLLRHGPQYSVVHCSSFPSLSLLGAWAGLLPHPRTKLVAHWIEVVPLSTQRHRRGLLGWGLWLLQALALRVGDAAVTKSSLHRERLRSLRYHAPVAMIAGFPAEDIAADTPELELPRQPTILFLGRLESEKRAHLVPVVLRELQRHDPRWRAVIFGDGPEAGRIERTAREVGVAESVEMRGFRPWKEVSAAMLTGSALVLPTMREGFGLVVIEAACHGLPTVLVAGPDNAATELIAHRRNGIVCPTADPAVQAEAVRELVADPTIHAKTRGWYEEARQRYSPAVAAKQLVELHARLTVPMN